MDNFELKRVPFINKSNNLESFSLRIASILQYQNKFLMVQNENEKKYKHPGGHIYFNETLFKGLKREILEETGVKLKDFSLGNVFFNFVMTSGNNLMLGAYIHTLIDKKTVDKILTNSPLPSKLFLLKQLTEDNSWETEIQAIKFYLESSKKK